MRIEDIDLGALAGDGEYVEAFLAAGHVPVLRKRNDGAQALDSTWADERDEHVGPHCSVCGYGLCVACDSVDDVPACDGIAGKLRRLGARRERLMRQVEAIDAEVKTITGDGNDQV